ncbi:hypothetical protein BDW75DRAFT_177956 [Aspergillus navahoensis]
MAQTTLDERRANPWFSAIPYLDYGVLRYIRPRAWLMARFNRNLLNLRSRNSTSIDRSHRAFIFISSIFAITTANRSNSSLYMKTFSTYAESERNHKGECDCYLAVSRPRLLSCQYLLPSSSPQVYHDM